jgi:exodeoxyribonuclease X
MLSRPYDLRVIDFETSDLPEKSGRIIEIGWTDLRVHREESVTRIEYLHDRPRTFRYSLPPGMKIDPAAKAIHGIWEEDLLSWDVLDALTLSSYFQCEAGTTRQFDYLIAHNSKFEEAMIKLYNNDPIQLYTIPPFICTMKVAKRVWPRADSHALPFLRYHADLEKGKRDHRCDPPHAAGPDTWLTSLLFSKMLSTFHVSIEEMRAFTVAPEFHAFCPLGKYKGKEWKEVDTGFLTWIAYKVPDMEEGLKEAAKLELSYRGGDTPSGRFNRW